MELVILDGYALNPGDLSWDIFKQYGNLTVYDRSTSEEVLERSKGADLLFTNKTKITSEVIKACKNLKYIGELATGFDNIDIKTAAAQGIPVCNIPGYSTPTVAQITWAHIMELTNQISKRSEEVHGGAWVSSKDFSFGGESLSELNGKTLALIGLGKIGSAVAQIGLALGMKVIAAVRNPDKYRMEGIEITVDTDRCFKEADILSLHCPLTDENQEMVNHKRIKMMKSTAFIVNTARGGLIHEVDLADALNSGRIAGAGLDVLSSEPPQSSNPLLSAKNCLITPHIAWASKEARTRLLHIASDNIRAFLDGKPKNRVN